MANRITGMYSGMDTESLIQDLMKAKRKKVDTMTRQKTKMEWKQELWTDLNKKIKTFYSKTVGNMRWTSSYMKKATSVSNNAAVSVITGEKAMNSVQNLSIKKLASSGYLTGAAVKSSDGSEVKSSSLVSSLSFENGSDAFSFEGSGSFSVTTGGQTTQINIDETTTIASVVDQLNGAGISANFDEKNGRLFIGAKTSGSDADFTITADNEAGNKALSVLGINVAPSDKTIAEYESLASFSGFIGASDAETVDLITDLDPSHDAYKKLMSMAKKNQQAEADAKQAAVDRVTSLEKRIEDLNAQRDNATLTDEDIAKIDEEIASAQSEVDEIKGGKELSELQEELDELKAGLNSGEYSQTAMNKAAASLTQQVQYASTYDATNDSMINSGAKKLNGENALIELNGVEFESDSNNFEINGLTFTCKAVADDITVTTQDDTDGIYDMIKSFIKDYNTLINEIDSLYNAESTKIEPLTDEEKDAVSETEAEKLEKKVRDSLLRKDDSLERVFEGLRGVMAEGIEINGETLYLSDFGIDTGSYLLTKAGERNAYHIDGDPDDESTSGNADKLKTLIATDPDKVVSFFSQLGRNLDQKLTDISKGDDYASFGSFYNDKQMKTDMSDYENKIAEAERKLQDEEDKLYDKFAAMEVALSKMDSKNSYISSLFS